MHNVEFKAELRDPALARLVLRKLGGRIAATALHDDEHLQVLGGRLIRRSAVILDGDQPDAVIRDAGDRPRLVEYISYDRPNRATPKISRFSILTESQAHERFGEGTLPVRRRLRKIRRTAMIGHVRVQLDDVAELGEFIEIEALVTREHTLPVAHERVAELREALAMAMGEPIAGSYVDLLGEAPALAG